MEDYNEENSKISVTNRSKTTAIREISSTNVQIMQLDMIRIGIEIIASIHKMQVFEHFKYLQGGNTFTGNIAGYQG